MSSETPQEDAKRSEATDCSAADKFAFIRDWDTHCESVVFSGRTSGDCECFCWDDVPEGERHEVTPDPWHEEIAGRLYPDDVMAKLGVEEGKRYYFTITAVEVPGQ